MLRITTSETEEGIRVLLEGKLGGPWVVELQQLLISRRMDLHGRAFVVDLRGLTGTDTAGRKLLARLSDEGALLENATPLVAALLGGAMQGQIPVVPEVPAKRIDEIIQ